MSEPENDSSSSSQRRQSQLPALAPRSSNSSARERSSGSASGSSRPPRLSHRSRQGCWTCRARKVKCDEVHPKCGPCTRLDRECDWDHRWNFNNATTSTQVKHSNVKTAGNVVWDPDAQRESSQEPGGIAHDDLPAFQALTTDEERERKAETTRPGTYGVVVTPDSFSDLPEYAGSTPTETRRPSLQSHRSSFTGTSLNLSRSSTRVVTDPNVVVLDRFEEASPTSTLPWLVRSLATRPAVLETQQYLPVTTPLEETFYDASAANAKADDALIAHFRRHVVDCLIQPQLPGTSAEVVIPGSTRNVFEADAEQFSPLHHAICALSALALAYRGGSTIEEALQHYHQALSTLMTASSTDDLSRSGVFLRHFLLLIFDICFTVPDESAGTATWTIHLSNLRQSAVLRYQQFGTEPHSYLLWRICQLDLEACLLGHGNCDFLRVVLRHNMLPPLERMIAIAIPAPALSYLPDEAATFPGILALNRVVVIQTANLAQAAQTMRAEAAEMDNTISPSTTARWQAAVTRMQSELHAYWAQQYPPYLDPDGVRAADTLAGRVRHVFEQALILYHAAIIYSRTSVFPHQRRIPIANQLDLAADTESRVRVIVAIAAKQLQPQPQLQSQPQLAGAPHARHTVFPLFIAGFATAQPDVKIQALDLIRGFEGGGIGQNCSRTRQLLKAVYEEQGRRVDEGGRMEDVDWLALARVRGLAVVNCGL